MVSNGKFGDTNTNTIQLRAIATTHHSDSTFINELALAPRDCAQTVSFCTSVASISRRIAAMLEKGYELTAVAGHDGKLISAFTKATRPDSLNVLGINDADPGISHAYRLSANTLQHVAHNGHEWLFGYLPEKKYLSQALMKSITMEALLAQIKGNWKRGYRVTSLTQGAGHWIAVATQLPNAEEQSYFTACDAEALQEKTRQAWDDGRKITCITYGGGKWLVILNKTETIASQKWVTRKSFVDLRSKIREEWSRGFQVTSLARGEDVWLAVLSRINQQ
ncbi:MAG: hypothetical protein SGJ27_12365 [Candidatus Melainabacteria bacterium]|nr:hypothetical protein [Candidatus Melainabacteria bacterium]